MARGWGVDATGRSKRSERFSAWPHGIYATAAYKALSGPATKLLLDLLGRYNGSNNGEISYSVREAAAVGIGKNVATRAFWELQDMGFLVMRHDAAFLVKDASERRARTWEITWLPTKSHPALRTYERWQPPRGGAE